MWGNPHLVYKLSTVTVYLLMLMVFMLCFDLGKNVLDRLLVVAVVISSFVFTAKFGLPIDVALWCPKASETAKELYSEI